MNLSISNLFKISVTSLMFCIFFYAIFLSQIVFANDVQFGRPLKMGMTGEDVLELQKILNKDEKTKVGDVGPGSFGQETSYFGPKTAIAVMKFQELYANEVLLPAGITKGTGYVGSFTLAKLNKLRITVSPFPTPTPESLIKSPPPSPLADKMRQKPLNNGVISQKDAFSPFSPSDLLIFGTSHSKLRAGDQLHITGFGFGYDTVVNIGNIVTVKAFATSSSDIFITIPAMLYGTYDIWVSNSRGSSKDKTPHSITVGAVTDNRPKLQSVGPSDAGMNDTIVVTADKLDFSGNTIYSNLGIIRNISSSDGKSMSFKVSQLPNASTFSKSASVNRFVVTFGVGTSEGQSINYGFFTLTR